MAKETYLVAQARSIMDRIGSALATLVSGQNPDSTAFTMSVDVASSVPIVPAASATGTGLTAFFSAALSAAVAVKASAGRLYGYHIQNPNAAGVFVQIFNVAAGSVVLGTTTPIVSLFVPAGGALDGVFAVPISFSAAISAAATTTPGGAVAPTTPVVGNLFYA
jgi:hypothetical protein